MHQVAVGMLRARRWPVHRRTRPCGGVVGQGERVHLALSDTRAPSSRLSRRVPPWSRPVSSCRRDSSRRRCGSGRQRHSSQTKQTFDRPGDTCGYGSLRSAVLVRLAMPEPSARIVNNPSCRPARFRRRSRWGSPGIVGQLRRGRRHGERPQRASRPAAPGPSLPGVARKKRGVIGGLRGLQRRLVGSRIRPASKEFARRGRSSIAYRPPPGATLADRPAGLPAGGHCPPLAIQV